MFGRLIRAVVSYCQRHYVPYYKIEYTVEGRGGHRWTLRGVYTYKEARKILCDWLRFGALAGRSGKIVRVKE